MMESPVAARGEGYPNSADEWSQSDRSDSDSDGLDSRKTKSKKRPHEQTKKSVRVLLGAVLRTIEERGFNAVSIEDRDRLAEATEKTGHPTALHVLADSQEEELPENDEQLQSLVKLLATPGQRRLLAVRDYTERTPLHMAISNRKKEMVKWMCEAYDNIDEILAVKSGKGGNCIHYAIESERSIAAFLVELASEATLSAKNEDGNTPLHLAVDYRRIQSSTSTSSSKRQLELVMAIIKKCDRYMKTTKDGDLNRYKKSPYIHYLETREQARAEIEKSEKTKKNDEPRKAQEDGSDTENTSRDQNNFNPNRPQSTGVLPIPTDNSFGKPQRRSTREFNGDVYSKRMTVPGKDIFISKDIVMQPKTTTLSVPNSGLPSIMTTTNLGGKRTPSEVNSSTGDKSSLGDEIGRFLKLHYLRTRDHTAALEILYGGGTTSEKDTAIFFDVSEYKTTSKIEKIISILKFENILQSVHIPKLVFEDAPALTNSANTKRSRGRDGIGRNELERVFGLLREKDKGVTTILKLIVDDLEAPAHSDVAIERAVRGMGVEIWDWKKIDLSPEVIRKAAPDVREIHLYWSGQDSVLRGWSEEEGLPQLKGLQKIVLHVQQKGIIDPQARIDENVDEFKTRMYKHTAATWALEKAELSYTKSTKEVKAILKEMVPVLRTLKVREKNEDGIEKSVLISKSRGKQLSEDIRSSINDKLVSRTMKEILKAVKEAGKVSSAVGREEIDVRVKEKIKIMAQTMVKNSDQGTREIPKDIASMIGRKVAQKVVKEYRSIDIEVPKFRRAPNTPLNRLASVPDTLEQPEKHRWIETMDEFKSLLFQAEKKWAQDTGPKGLNNVKNIKEAIEVAIIDDGADTTELQLGLVGDITGHSFCHDDMECPSPWYTSTGGHGTIMASQVHRICPMAKLYILKLEDTVDPEFPKDRRITIASATKAIRQAVTMKVHIISMSWTIQSLIDRTQDQTAIADLEAAIREAATNKILMFCSASDEGVGENLLSYPYKASSDIIKIGAADVNGKLFDKVGDTSTVSFFLPGKEVEGEGLTDAVVSKIQYLTGSSVSTALAAGLAALILYCAQARYLLAREDLREKARRDYELLKTHDKMREAFREIGTTDASGQKYIKVWEVFGRRVGTWKDSEMRGGRGQSPISIVASVADTLCAKF